MRLCDLINGGFFGVVVELDIFIALISSLCLMHLFNYDSLLLFAPGGGDGDGGEYAARGDRAGGQGLALQVQQRGAKGEESLEDRLQPEERHHAQQAAVPGHRRAGIVDERGESEWKCFVCVAISHIPVMGEMYTSHFNEI